jgi:hypothetical protein
MRFDHYRFSASEQLSSDMLHFYWPEGARDQADKCYEWQEDSYGSGRWKLEGEA